jgi:hypothetical protein
MSNEFAALEDEVENLLNRLERAERERDEYAASRRRQSAAREAAEDRDRLTIERALRAEARAQKAEAENAKMVKDYRAAINQRNRAENAASKAEVAIELAKDALRHATRTTGVSYPKFWAALKEDE